MECQGCFICCHDDRHKYPIIQEIEIIGSEWILLNGTYKLTSFCNLKPQYKKISKLELCDHIIYLYWHNEMWELNDGLFFVTQHANCPITLWEEKNNNYDHINHVEIKMAFNIVTFTTDIKPAK